MQAEKSSKTQHKIHKIIEERDKTLQFDHFRANPPPKPQVKSPHETNSRLFSLFFHRQIKFLLN
jgi:hypothetical protein